MTEPGELPGWLVAVVVRLGPFTYAQVGEVGHRWMWADGDYGLRIDRGTHAWEVFGWSPLRSVSVRLAGEPTSADMATVASMAGLGGPAKPSPRALLDLPVFSTPTRAAVS